MERNPENRVQPIAPIEVTGEKNKHIPNEVIAMFNDIIVREMHGGRARVIQNEVVERLEAEGLNRGAIFKNHWLDVEDLFREVGWKVTYDKPGYNESYDAYFIFSTT